MWGLGILASNTSITKRPCLAGVRLHPSKAWFGLDGFITYSGGNVELFEIRELDGLAGAELRGGAESRNCRYVFAHCSFGSAGTTRTMSKC
jgi:hypothetical protein